MNQTEFLSQLQMVSRQYNWSYVDNRLTGVCKSGVNRGLIVNPITAVAASLKAGLWSNNKRETLRAARALGMSNELAQAIYSQSNRGHAQIVRGKMLSAVAH